MFCTKFTSRIKALLLQFDCYVNDHIDVALSITTEIKNLLSAPLTADILSVIFPLGIENTLRQEIINALSMALQALTIADNCKSSTTINDKVTCFITQLKLQDPNFQDAILQKLASLLAFHLDGGRLKQNLYDMYTQAKYTATK